MADHPPIRCRSRVVELVHNDVVERSRVDLVETLRERLHAGQHDVGVEIEPLAFDQANVGVRLNSSKHFSGLIENLFAVGHEKNPAELGPGTVETCQPGLAQTSCHHHQPSTKSISAGGR